MLALILLGGCASTRAVERPVDLLPPVAAAPAPPEPPTLRIATYNILAGDRGLKGIIETLRTANADVIALQEVDRLTRRSKKVDQASVIAAALKMSHAFVSHFPYQGGEFGVALLSRFPIEDVQRHQAAKSRLALLSAKVRAPTGPIEVVVVHFNVTMPFDESAKQAKSDAARLQDAKKAFDLAGLSKLPLIIAGDFNDDTGSPPYELMKEAKLQDSCAGNVWSKTWSSTLPVTRIDYVWASGHFTVHDCRTLSSDASDHLPVVAVLGLR
jgi:endonuclease/exonuclease/phosphatase family metal-dependent hydrolase